MPTDTTDLCPQETINMLRWLLNNPPIDLTANNAQHYSQIARLTGETLTQLTQYLMAFHTLHEKAVKANGAFLVEPLRENLKGIAQYIEHITWS